MVYSRLGLSHIMFTQALEPEHVADAHLVILGLLPRAYVPELVVYPNQW